MKERWNNPTPDNPLENTDQELCDQVIGELAEQLLPCLQALDQAPGLSASQIGVTAEIIERSISITKAIATLHRQGEHPQECCALQGMLTERLTHLTHMMNHGNFHRFVLWSMANRYHAINRSLRDPRASQGAHPNWIEHAQTLLIETERTFQGAPKEPSYYWQPPDQQHTPSLSPIPENPSWNFLYQYMTEEASRAIHPAHDDSIGDQLQMLVPILAILTLSLIIAAGISPTEGPLKNRITAQLGKSIERIVGPT